jgi:uncharacterized OB-fold protein
MTMSDDKIEEGVGVWRCPHCGQRFFPRRLLCLACHTPEMTEDRVNEARVEEIAVIRHMIGQSDWKPRRIANVMTPQGVPLTVGLEDDAAVGDRIRLYQRGTAAFGCKA